MIDMPIVVRSFFLYLPEELKQSLDHHRDITFAARARDGLLGMNAMQLHLRMSHARVLRHRKEWQSVESAKSIHKVAPKRS
jgi:DNA-binding GntR family transcriptional regulator